MLDSEIIVIWLTDICLLSALFTSRSLYIIGTKSFCCQREPEYSLISIALSSLAFWIQYKSTPRNSSAMFLPGINIRASLFLVSVQFKFDLLRSFHLYKCKIIEKTFKGQQWMMSDKFDPKLTSAPLNYTKMAVLLTSLDLE